MKVSDSDYEESSSAYSPKDSDIDLGDGESDSSGENHMKKNDDEDDEARAKRQRRALPDVRLLLHTEDGVVPFLTPNLLRQAFPEKQVANVLLLGLAVRDTCVVPVFPTANPNASHLNANENQVDKKLKATKKRKVTDSTEKTTSSAPPKPRGYAFSDQIRCGDWMLRYSRVTVPSFDPFRDYYGDPAQPKAGRKPNNDTKVSSFGGSSTAVPSSTHAMALWTMNGRQCLTAPQYCGSASGLNGTTKVPLFEPIIPMGHNVDAKTEVKRLKRKQAVVQQNQLWTEQIAARMEYTRTWAPFAVDPDAFDDVDREHIKWIAKKIAAVEGHKIQGCALIGWHYVGQASQRRGVLNAIRAGIFHCDNVAFARNSSSGSTQSFKPSIAVLTTSSLRHILEVLQFAASAGPERVFRTVVGTDRPTVWARSKRAFLVDILYPQGLDSLDDADADSKKEALSPLLDEEGCFSLNPPDGAPVNQHPWFRDKNPLMKGCSCLTCRTHSRAYLYHLVCAKEMLGEMLLFIHNLHHLLALVRSVNKCLQLDRTTVLSLCSHVQQQLAED